MKLLAIPYAGGSANLYMKWKPHLSPEIQLVLLEPAGRGQRQHVPFKQSIHEAADDLCSLVEMELARGESYALYGHSMGGILATELYHRLVERKLPLPIHMFISGCRPPHLSGGRSKISNLPESQLKLELGKIGGTPAEVLQSTELMSYFLPIIRADFRLLEEYVYEPKALPIACDFSLLGGTEDVISGHQWLQWEEYTTGKVSLDWFEGGHIFIHEHYPAITALIKDRLALTMNVKSRSEVRI